MKRFLSIILGLALVISMIPATFAAEGEKSTVVYSPEYVFVAETGFSDEAGFTENSTELHSKNSSFVFNREVSSGIWSYTGKRLGINFYMYKAAKAAGTQAYTATTTLDSENSFLMNITVDADGVYIPTLNFTEWANGGQIKFYVIDKTVFAEKGYSATTKAGIETIIADSKIADSGVWCVADYNSWAATSKNGIVKSGNAFELKAGDYYLMLTIAKGNGDSSHDSRTYAYIKSLTFTRQPYVSLSSDFEEIEIGKTAELTSSAKLGDEVDADADITYTVVPEGVVSIAPDGTVTALSEGTAKITAKATIGEKEYSDSVDIKVKPIDKTHNFMTGFAYLTDASTELATADAAVYDSRDKGFLACSYANNGIDYFDSLDEIDENKDTADWAISSLGGEDIYLFQDHIDIYCGKVRYGNNSFGSTTTTPVSDARNVFKIKINYPGTYDISADVIMRADSSEADVFIVKTDEVDSSSLLHSDTSATDGKRMSHAFLKTLPIDGRVSGVGTSGTKTDYICTKTLEAGEYYVILHMNTDNPVTSGSYQKQILSVKSFDFVESQGTVETPGTPVEAKSTVSFGTNIDGVLAAKTVDRGSTVELYAPEMNNAGEVFKCWVRGTEENGVWVSSKANDTYKVMTNTYLTAVYEAAVETDGKVVEFYNENGEYYATVAAVDGKAVLPTENPSLAGYTFAGWYISEEDMLEEGAELTADITYAVAKYTPQQVIGKTKEDNVKVENVASTEYNFGATISCSDAKATYWLREGRIVKFGTSYEHNIWDGTNIMFSSDTTTAIRPLVVIEDSSIDGAYMIEYDKGNQTISEVGILFGNSAKMTVDSCSYKATSQWNRDHGQFMAKPYGDTSDEAYARGYMIYGSAGNYQVIYTEAIEIQ